MTVAILTHFKVEREFNRKIIKGGKLGIKRRERMVRPKYKRRVEGLICVEFPLFLMSPMFQKRKFLQFLTLF